MSEDTNSTADAPEMRQDTPLFWKRWLKAAKGEECERHFKAGRAAWNEYEKRDSNSGVDDAVKAKPYPIYWASCKILEPAYYARTPKILSTRRCGIKDGIALTMSLIVERLGEYFVDSTDFDDVMQSAVLDFIHSDKATTQVTFDLEPRRIKKRVNLIPDKKGKKLVREDGLPGADDHPYQEDAQGPFIEEPQMVNWPKIKFMPSSFDETLHTPDARCEAEITEKAYYFYMPQEQAEQRFPGKEINWKTGKKKDIDDVDGVGEDDEGPVSAYVEGWECWCKTTGKVYWVSDQCHDGFLDVQEDPYRLRNFFPSPKFIIGSRPSKHLYPTPIFIQLLPLIDELHCAAARVSTLIERIKRRALIDGSNPELILALNRLDDGEYVAVENLQQILEKGSIDNMVWFVPVRELVQAITELASLQDKFKDEFFEWFGVPDILRGQTDPIETAGAQELKTGAAHDRFKFPKKLVARLARDSIELMIDLALSVMEDEQIAEIVNVKYWEEPHQQRFSEALETLRDDDMRLVRVDIDTDSMSFLDDHIRSQKVNMGVTTLSRGLEQIAQMMDKEPAYANVALQALLLMLENLGLGKEFNDILKESIGGLIEQAQNPPEDEQAPDYEMLKIEVNRMKAESQAMARHRELDQGEYRLQIQAMTAQSKAEKDATELQIEGYKAQLDEVVQTFMMQLEGQRVQLEEQRVQIERFNSEVKAQVESFNMVQAERQAEIAEVETLMASMKEASASRPEDAQVQPPQIINVQAPAMPPINVMVDAKQSSPPVSKRVSVVRDEMGNAMGYEVMDTPTDLGL